MNPELKRYRRHIKQRLHCVGYTRRKLLEELDRDLARFAAEEPSASYADAARAVGAPEELAAAMNKTLTEYDIVRFQRRKWLLRGAVVVAFVMMVGYVYYLWKCVTTPIVYDQVTVIYAEQPDPEESEQSATETDTTETEETDPTETEETDAVERGILQLINREETIHEI